MFKVLIVDDEAIIRKGLRNIIDWESLQCTVCDEACDGVEGMEKIKYHKPEIVIVDIKMPGISGLEMIRTTKKIIPHAKIIILTGYRDFEYLKEAIQYGAFDYVLKPSKVDNISSIVRKAVLKLQEESRKLEEIKTLKKSIESTLPLLKQKILYDLLFNINVKNEKLFKDMELCGININKFYILILRIQCNKKNSDVSTYHYGIINSLVDIYSDLFKVDYLSVNERTMAFIIQPVEENEKIDELIRNKLVTLKNLIKEYYSFEVISALSREGSGVLQLHKKMEEVIVQINQNEAADREDTESGEYRLFDYKKESSNEEKHSISLVIRNAMQYIADNYTCQISLNDVAEHTYVSSYYLSRMFTKELGKSFVDYLNEVRIEKAKKYLKEDYHKTYEVADMVGIKDPHYFSKLFKKYTGLTPSEFKEKIQ